MNDDKRNELLTLLREHRGRERAVTKQEIASRLKMTTRQVEHGIREWIIVGGVNIASACDRKPFGYFVIENEAEAKRYRNQLISRMRKLNERLAAVDSNTAKAIHQALQKELFS